MTEEAEFDAWNQTKKKLQKQSNAYLFPKEREVWMCSIGRNLGSEQNGSGENFGRPVLVIKKFNNGMFWAVPLSSKQKDFDFYYNFTDPNNASVAVILAQLRLVSIKRFRRNMYLLPEILFEEIRTTIGDFLKSKPRTRRGFSEPEGTL
jgi:mRNA interferase MazF